MKVTAVWSDRLVRGLVLVVASLLLFGTGLYTGVQVVQSQLSCLVDNATASAEALSARQDPTLARDEAEVAVFQVTLDLLRDRAEAGELAAALSAYAEANDVLTRVRQTNPYPDPPKQAC